MGVKRTVYVSHLGADRASAYPAFKAKAIAEGGICAAAALGAHHLAHRHHLWTGGCTLPAAWRYLLQQ